MEDRLTPGLYLEMADEPAPAEGVSVWENVRCAVLWSMGARYSFWRDVDGLADVRERTERILREINLLDRHRVQAGVRHGGDDLGPGRDGRAGGR